MSCEIKINKPIKTSKHGNINAEEFDNPSYSSTGRYDGKDSLSYVSHVTDAFPTDRKDVREKFYDQKDGNDLPNNAKSRNQHNHVQSHNHIHSKNHSEMPKLNNLKDDQKLVFPESNVIRGDNDTKVEGTVVLKCHNIPSYASTRRYDGRLSYGSNKTLAEKHNIKFVMEPLDNIDKMQFCAINSLASNQLHPFLKQPRTINAPAKILQKGRLTFTHGVKLKPIPKNMVYNMGIDNRNEQLISIPYQNKFSNPRDNLTVVGRLLGYDVSPYKRNITLPFQIPQPSISEGVSKYTKELCKKTPVRFLSFPSEGDIMKGGETPPHSINAIVDELIQARLEYRHLIKSNDPVIVSRWKFSFSRELGRLTQGLIGNPNKGLQEIPGTNTMSFIKY